MRARPQARPSGHTGGLTAAELPPDGRSVEGRVLHVRRIGDADAPRRVLVVGSMHGDEPEGRRVVRLLARRAAPGGVQFALIEDLNPDGSAARTRWNARGVDLNRNFRHRWRGGPRGRYYPGPRPASEPETRWAMRVVRAFEPQVSVWLHQPYGFVVRTPGADRDVVRRYAERAGMPLRALPRYRGTVAGWQNARSRRSSAFVVELGAGRADASKHLAAIRAVARRPAAAAHAGTSSDTRSRCPARFTWSGWIGPRTGHARAPARRDRRKLQ